MEHSKALVIHTIAFVRDMASFALQTHFQVDSIQKESIQDCFEGLECPISLIVCSANFGEEELVKLLTYRQENSSETPIFLTDTDSLDPFEKLKDQASIEVLGIKNMLEDIHTNVKKYFNEVSTQENEEHHCEVAFQVLPHLNGVEEDVYIKMSVSKKYVKIYREGDLITQQDVDKYAAKGVHTLFFKRPLSLWILKEVNKDFDKKVEAVEKGEAIQLDTSTKPIDDTPHDPEEPPVEDEKLPEPQSTEGEKPKPQVPQTVEGQKNEAPDPAPMPDDSPEPEKKAGPTMTITEEKKEEKPAPTGPTDAEKSEKVFKMEEDEQDKINNSVKKTLGMMKKSPNLNKVLKNLVVNREKDKYYTSHVDLLCQIGCGISKLMGWTTDATLEKIIFSAHMHDVTLTPYPGLAEIQTLEEFEARKDEFSAKAQKAYLDHPQAVFDLIANMPEAPAEANQICLSHHENAHRTGFPNKLQAVRLTPLAALFIVAHDLVCYILENPEWTPQDYIKGVRSKFPGSKFSKVIAALKKMKPL